MGRVGPRPSTCGRAGSPALVAVLVLCVAPQAEDSGIKAVLSGYSGPATVSVEMLQKHDAKVSIHPRSESEPLNLLIELSRSGKHAWPIHDVEVRDAGGRAVRVRRPGIEWHKLHLRVPAESAFYRVRAVPRGKNRPKSVPESKRTVSEPMTGMSATVTRWYDGKGAAVSLRFDDSHVTHLTKVVPILREYGFRGTFMVNPGKPDGKSPNPRWRSAFQDHLAGWRKVAQEGDHEFANHTLHHRGARGDADMDEQIGEASKALWSLAPGVGRLRALNLGGGTWWETTKTLRYYLDRYDLFTNSGSTGMDDVYGNRVPTLRRLLESHLKSGGWYRVHYHYIGNGLSTSEENFRAALEVIKEHQESLWIAGMADIEKYRVARSGAQLSLKAGKRGEVRITLRCATDSRLYDHPLTLEIRVPDSWKDAEVRIAGVEGKAVKTKHARFRGERIIRFDPPPVDAVYVLQYKGEP